LQKVHGRSDKPNKDRNGTQMPSRGHIGGERPSNVEDGLSGVKGKGDLKGNQGEEGL